jgi:hypothetical protein
MRRMGVTIVVGASLLVAGFAYGGSGSTTTASFACPSDPKTQPLGKIYGKNRGSSFCNDGAKASLVVKGTKISLVGGVCWKSRDGFNVGIGTVVNDRKKADPAGVWLIDTKPGNLVGNTIDTGKGTVDWVGPVNVKLAKNKKSGTFSATATAVAVNGKLSGSFTCKRVLDAPDQ